MKISPLSSAKPSLTDWHKSGRRRQPRPSLTREKVRRLELIVGAERRQGKRNPRVCLGRAARLEKELARQAEVAYERLVKDWQPQGKRGAGATPERASQKRGDCLPS